MQKSTESHEQGGGENEYHLQDKGGVVPGHWDPADAKDLKMIHRYAGKHKARFATMGDDGQALVVNMFKLASQVAETASKTAQDHRGLVDAGRLAAAAASVGVHIVKIQQQDEHHAEDLAVAQANAVTNAVAAGVPKVYKGLERDKILGGDTDETV